MLGAYESCVGLPNKKQVQAKLSKELGTESLLFLPVLNVATTNCRKAAKKEVYRPPESSGTSKECSVLSSLSPPLNQPILHFSISSRPSQCTWYLSKGLLVQYAEQSSMKYFMTMFGRRSTQRQPYK